jgi:hypothetical protein
VHFDSTFGSSPCSSGETWGRRGVEDHCRSVEKAGEHFHPWGMAEENRAIYLCRGLRHTLAEDWTPDFKHWN